MICIVPGAGSNEYKFKVNWMNIGQKVDIYKPKPSTILIITITIVLITYSGDTVYCLVFQLH